MTPKNEFRIEGDVVWIKLTQGKETCIDLADWPEVQKYRWHAHKQAGKFYVWSDLPRVNGKKSVIRLHRIITQSDKADIDHKDGDGLNNRRYNLRPGTHAQNMMNGGIRSNNTSGFKGVSWDRVRCKWGVRIKADGRYRNIGRFTSIIDAAKAYNAAAVAFFGEFANLNP
jgi:hypothetical protein